MVEGVMRSQDLGRSNMMPMGPLHQHRSILLCLNPLSRFISNIFFFLSLLESTAYARHADGPNADADADAAGNAAGDAHAGDAARDANGPDANADADANATGNATRNADGPNADANANADAARDATRYAGIWSHRGASTH